jgi:hypothetical protein
MKQLAAALLALASWAAIAQAPAWPAEVRERLPKLGAEPN